MRQAEKGQPPTVADADTIAAYTEMWKNKQGAKRSRKDLFDFVERQREFTQTGRKKKGKKNPFSPPDMQPNRGMITREERGLKNGVYLDSEVLLVKGKEEHLTDTNYMSDDIRATLKSHQRGFCQSGDGSVSGTEKENHAQFRWNGRR